MTQRQYKHGTDRNQRHLLPASIEEYVSAENPVRAIDLYVNCLDLKALGFQNTECGISPGQPAFPPGALLKLYLYGYLHRLRSSRRLEAECVRNLEVIWLVEALRPRYKTIADFRKDNLEALKAVNCDFVQLCKELQLFGAELVSIDGSYFRGNVGKGSIYTAQRLQQSLQRLEQTIQEYLQALDQADLQEADQPGSSERDLLMKLEQLRQRQQQQQERLRKLQESGEKQLAEVDPQARLLSKRGQSVAGYNVQAVVDEKYKLLVLAEATQAGNDTEQLEPMAKAAQAVLEVEKLEVVADAGYFNAQGIQNCQTAHITPYVPEPDRTTQAKDQGRFGREQFVYEVPDNQSAPYGQYRCPAGQVLSYRFTQDKNGKAIWMYRSSAPVCAQCPLKDQCLPAKTGYRTIARWEHEETLEDHRKRMAQHGREKMSLRRCLSEHPFGTLKLRCGWTHFLLRGLQKVGAELSLLMLTYNFTRVLNILGLDRFRTYCFQRAAALP